MGEPYTFLIESEVDFDGGTKFTQTVGDFTRDHNNSRFRSILLTEAFGRIDSTIFQLFAADSPKLIGISSKFNNPFTVARVVTKNGDVDSFREEIDLTPEIQYVTLYPGDELVLASKDGGRTAVYLVVNEFGERDHIQYASAKPPVLHWRRYRIIRNSATGFSADLTDTWRPDFIFDATNNLLVANEVDQGPIPLDAFCTFPVFAGCLVRARFANVGATGGSLFVVEPIKKNKILVETVANMVWSKVASISHDDNISISSDDPLADDIVICDLMIAKIQAEHALQGLYDRKT